VEDDLLKSPEYERVRSEQDITTLFSERDRLAYKQLVPHLPSKK
jgi:hypothetical protein